MKTLNTYSVSGGGPIEPGEVPELVQLIVGLLNQALDKNRIQLSRLFKHSVLAEGMEEFFVTLIEGPNGPGVLGPLGVINGILIAAGIYDFRIYRDVEPNHPDEYINSFGAFKIQPELPHEPYNPDWETSKGGGHEDP